MHYELAKQLCDAGFIGNFGFAEGENSHTLIVCPLLSELIEACGDDFDCIRKYKQDLIEKTIWYCGSNKNDLSGNRLETTADTPEEAVAHLWLTLNEK